ncbi:MAG: hypothetical protein ACRCYU_06660 [Nocardioides sp.]
MSAMRLGGGRHVWVYRAGHVSAGLLTEWRRDRGSGWSGLVTFDELDTRGVPALLQQWIWAENLEPAGEDTPPPFRPALTRRDPSPEPPPYG